jgi:hypothetical protein
MKMDKLQATSALTINQMPTYGQSGFEYSAIQYYSSAVAHMSACFKNLWVGHSLAPLLSVWINLPEWEICKGPVHGRSTCSSSIMTEIESSLNIISEFVNLPNPIEIKNYLIEFPDLINVLICICVHTTIEFKTNTQFSLELFKDREFDDHYLSLYVRQNTYSKNIMERLEKLWLNFESEIAKSKGWINITTDFRSPN